MDYNDQNNHENECEKIVAIAFDEDSESYEEEYEEYEEIEELDEVWQSFGGEKSTFDIHEMVNLKQPWYIRIFNCFAFVILLCSCMAFLFILGGALIIGAIRYLMSDKKWKLSIRWWWKLYCRCLVLTLIAFVGIFNVQFALTILAVYFSLFDSSSVVMENLAKHCE